MNTSVLPRELRERPQWVLWRREIRDGKQTKIPFRASSPTLEASSTNPETWASFEDAVAAAGQADGVGFVFASDDPFTGVDLDDCLVGDDLHPEAAAVVSALGSFTETSPSGTGVHVLVRAQKNTGRCRLENAPWGGRLEVYDHARFFCVTGAHLRGTPAAIEPRQRALEEILDRLLPEPSTNGAASAPRRPVDLADSELLERMFAAKNGRDVEALSRGDTSRHGGDDSAADLALCSHLAFWTGNDADRIDGLFRSSGLMRDKWERDDYRERTIERAIAGTVEVYSGPPPTMSTRVDIEPLPPTVKAADEEIEDGPEPFLGLSHAEVLDLSFDGEPAELVEGLIPRGVLVLVAGLPETFKGWVCAKASMIVATGEGELFGRPALAQGAVGYFWSDDSTRAEAERVQLFARVHETPRDVAVRWFLNEGVVLPDDLERLRATIEHFGFVLVVLDSVYNFTPGLDLKDRAVGQLFARLKAEVCDLTGCTVVLVDHMPWANETNRKRLRSYGDVFKGAAARAGIYIDADGSKLYVEARGNSIAGFKRTPAYWDADALELRLVDTSRQEEADDELEERVLEYLLEAGEKRSTSAVRRDVKGRNERVDSALERLLERGEVRDVARGGGAWSGQGGNPRYWIASIHAEQTSPGLFGAGSGEVSAEAPESRDLARSPHPLRGGEVPAGRGSGEDFDHGERGLRRGLEVGLELSPHAPVAESSGSVSPTPRTRSTP